MFMPTLNVQVEQLRCSTGAECFVKGDVLHNNMQKPMQVMQMHVLPNFLFHARINIGFMFIKYCLKEVCESNKDCLFRSYRQFWHSNKLSY